MTHGTVPKWNNVPWGCLGARAEVQVSHGEIA
jgi:hypothetical protein